MMLRFVLQITNKVCRMATQSVCLIVIDGWGISSNSNGNAILAAKTPVMDRLCSKNFCELEAHGLHVGLPEGLMGNSEVGHLNIGAGRVIYQDIIRISMAVDSGEICNVDAVIDACNNAKSKTGRLHLLGLVSDGGVHSHIKHLFGLINAAKHHSVPNCFIHFFSDGRDTSPTSGTGYIQQVLDFVNKGSYGKLATIMGRYYAMDRDKRWERIKIAYDGLVSGVGDIAQPENVIAFIKERYDSDQTDEFLKPIIVNKEGCIQENDALIFIDFRADRMRQIVETLGIKRNFETNTEHPNGLKIYCMTQYDKKFSFPALFPPQTHKNVLAEWLSAQKCKQFHCAETEKFAHVTFFFNGGVEQSFDGEDRSLIDSPKVATYDLQPEMSATGVANKLAETIKERKYPFVMCNFAPPDMVGHTGKYEPAVKACETTDTAIGIIEDACTQSNYVMFVTSDHGNAEQMLDAKGGPHTAHTCNRVPFCSTGSRKLNPDAVHLGRAPALCDVAPTVLAQMGLPAPPEMTGKSLLFD